MEIGICGKMVEWFKAPVLDAKRNEALAEDKQGVLAQAKNTTVFKRAMFGNRDIRKDGRVV